MTEFIDSNVIIYAVTNSPYKDKCRTAMQRSGLVTNSIVLLEVYAKVSLILNKEQANRILKSIYRSPNIQIVDFGSDLFFEVMKRSQKYSLPISDLIHYTTALLLNCQAIISYDKHFNRLEIPRKEP